MHATTVPTAPREVLVIEDDPSIADSVVKALSQAGWSVRHVATGREGIAAPVADIVLLDLGLPDMDGYDVCRRLREHSSVPIIVITARGEELDRVLGLELGADDYVVKPFGVRELQARMRAVLRRAAPNHGDETRDDADGDMIVVGPLRIDRRSHRVTMAYVPTDAGVDNNLDNNTDNNTSGDQAGAETTPATEVLLTPKEYDLLVFLAEDAGAVRTRTDIIERVWDSNWFGPTKTVDAHVAGIRRKLGGSEWIEAVRGVGFRLGYS